MRIWERKAREEQDYREFSGALGGGGSVCVNCGLVEFEHSFANDCPDSNPRTKYKSERMAKAETEESQLEMDRRTG